MNRILGIALAVITLSACGPSAQCPEHSAGVELGDGGGFACEAACGYQPVGGFASEGMVPSSTDACDAGSSDTHASAPIEAPASTETVPDAGDPCSDRVALEACGLATASLAQCCTLNEYVSPTPLAFCEHIAGGDADVKVACKDIAALPCAEMRSEGLCY